MLCHSHGYPVKDTLEECDLIKCYFSGDYKMIGMGAPSGPSNNKEKGMRISTREGAL
jgi:hypothetical protein